MRSTRESQDSVSGDTRRPGFTLIELLIVVVIIGILALLAAAKVTAARDRAVVANLQSELRKLAVHQELYHHQHGKYSEWVDSIPDFTFSPGIELDFMYADTRGWAVVARHDALRSYSCGLFVGDEDLAEYAAPATIPGTMACGAEE